MDDSVVAAGHSGVIPARVSFPSAAPAAVPVVAIAVVNAAVITDSRPPVTLVKRVNAVVPAPPGRRPKHTNRRRSDPDTRDPIIIPHIITITPVTRRPDVTFVRARRLLVYRQRGRSKANRDIYLCERRHQRQCEKSS